MDFKNQKCSKGFTIDPTLFDGDKKYKAYYRGGRELIRNYNRTVPGGMTEIEKDLFLINRAKNMVNNSLNNIY